MNTKRLCIIALFSLCITMLHGGQFGPFDPPINREQFHAPNGPRLNWQGIVFSIRCEAPIEMPVSPKSKRELAIHSAPFIQLVKAREFFRRADARGYLGAYA